VSQINTDLKPGHGTRETDHDFNRRFTQMNADVGWRLAPPIHLNVGSEEGKKVGTKGPKSRSEEFFPSYILMFLCSFFSVSSVSPW